MASRKEDRFSPHELYLGIDVGKSFHWAVGVDAEGTVTIDRPLRNRQADVDALLEEAGTDICAAGKRRYRSLCGRLGAREAARDALWEAAVTSARDGFHPDAEDALVKIPAAEILSADAERSSLEADIASRLSGDETYRCLLTVPGVGAKTATTLVTLVDVSLFDGDDRLASYCGLAPANSQSGTSIDSASATRSGNKQLKNLLIFSCNSLVGTRNRFGRYYEECRSRGMRHNRALKAVARKRLGVIYAIMRDRVPYEEPEAVSVNPQISTWDCGGNPGPNRNRITTAVPGGPFLIGRNSVAGSYTVSPPSDHDLGSVAAWRPRSSMISTLSALSPTSIHLPCQ